MSVPDYLLILDFEATCNDVAPFPEPQEIIEFPTIALSTKTGDVVDYFHEYIRPSMHPKLTPFCTNLTGITQDMVDKGVTFEEALNKHRSWVFEKLGARPFGSAEGDSPTFLYCTCGVSALSHLKIIFF